MFVQSISLKKLQIASYFLFICLIPDTKDSFLETAMYTVSAVVTGFLLGCLYDYFQKQPAAKQTILVYSTRLVLLTNYLPILMDLMIVWTTIWRFADRELLSFLPTIFNDCLVFPCHPSFGAPISTKNNFGFWLQQFFWNSMGIGSKLPVPCFFSIQLHIKLSWLL